MPRGLPASTMASQPCFLRKNSKPLEKPALTLSPKGVMSPKTGFLRVNQPSALRRKNDLPYFFYDRRSCRLPERKGAVSRACEAIGGALRCRTRLACALERVADWTGSVLASFRS